MASQEKKAKIVLYIAFVQALIAMLGSLFFDWVLHFAPCVLCWYQRVCIFPMVVILAVCIIKKDKNAPYLILPLSLIGLGISIYHNLLYYKVIPESIAPCTIGTSCTTQYINWLGFISIPLLSFCALTVITVCMIFYLQLSKHSTVIARSATTKQSSKL